MTGLPPGTDVLAAALVLGATHGFEPDHAAGISAMTADADGWAHAAFVGGAFAVGHVLVVLGWLVLLTALGQAVAASSEAFEVVTSGVVGIALVGVALLLATTGSRRFRGLPPRPTPAGASGPVEATVARVHANLAHAHETRVDYLRTGVIGSLFALSPPVSMLALVTAVIPARGLGGAVEAIAVYAVVITATMALVGGGVGSLSAVAAGRGEKVHAVFELATSVLVLGFAVRLLL